MFSLKAELNISQHLQLSLEVNLQEAKEHVNCYMEENKEIQQILDKEKRKVQDCENMIEVLKEKMTEMDTQLKVFMNLSFDV